MSQIKRLHQKGRDRAIIGLVLSYFMIVVVVVALVVWAVIGDSPGSTSSAASSTRSAEPTASAAATPGPTDPKSLERYLLTSKDWSDVQIGSRRISTFGGPHIGGADKLARVSGSCDVLNATMSLAGYESTPATGFAMETWYPGWVMFPFNGIVAFPTPDAAQTTFSDFTKRWIQCKGHTVPYTTDATRTVTEVTATEDTVIALTMSDGSTAYQRNTRAIGVRRNYIVEVHLDGWPNASGEGIDVAGIPEGEPEARTARAIQRMFDNIDKGS